jgi:hypothetical protein
MIVTMSSAAGGAGRPGDDRHGVVGVAAATDLMIVAVAKAWIVARVSEGAGSLWARLIGMPK